MKTHRGFIQDLLDSKGRFNAVLDEAVEAGIVSQQQIGNWRGGRYTPKESIKNLLNRLKGQTPTTTSSDLNRLIEIVHRNQTIRSQLDTPDLWQEVFSRTSLQDEPVSVEQIGHQGRCNYIYRIYTQSGNRYVVRYLDPIGREFLQRYEPKRAVHLYCGAEKLIGMCLAEDGVVPTEFPDIELGTWNPDHVVDEDDALLNGNIVADRSLLQDDHSTGHFLLADYADQSPKLTVDEVINLYVRPLAQLHARSCGLDRRARRPTETDALAQTLSRYSNLLRFDTPERYGGWLDGGYNWMTGRVLDSLKNAGNHGQVWSRLLNRFGCTASNLTKKCRALWKHSAEAMTSSGSLVHFDYNPTNCFIDDDMSHIKIFDFDYVAIIDAAYEIGISINALVRLLMLKEGLDSAEQILGIIEQFFKRYEHYYTDAIRDVGSIVELSPADLQRLLDRAKAFSGLTLAATLDDDYRNPSTVLSQTQKEALIGTCGDLLRRLPQ